MLQKHLSQYTDQELAEWINQLVVDESPESMVLEYKSEQTFNQRARLELAIDISAFANCNGGVIIYGIPCRTVESGHGERTIPERHYGINPIREFESRVANSVYSLIFPRLPNLHIRRIPILRDNTKVVYIVWHPESWLSPHRIQSTNEYGYYRRGLGRNIQMTEPEIRNAYVRAKNMIEASQEFINSSSINYIKRYFPDAASISQFVSCPQLLVDDRVDFTNDVIRDWLRTNIFPQFHITGGQSSIQWYPSMFGVQVGMKEQVVLETVSRQAMYYWIELYRNGSINVLWQTRIFKGNNDLNYLNWQHSLRVLRDCLNFSKNYYEKISFYSPIHFRFCIDKLGYVLLKPADQYEDAMEADLPNDTFFTELIRDSSELIEHPETILKQLADRLFESYGKWEAPNLSNLS